jgi:hypothetical protein
MVRLTAGRPEAEAYVHRRIGNVMTFEKWKASLPKRDLASHAATLLGKLRYPAPRPGAAAAQDAAERETRI